MKRHLLKNAVIALALLATGFFGAYLRFRPHLGNQSGWTDGEQHFESTVDEEIRYAVWDEPLPLPPEINSDDSESRPALSPDGLYLVFVAGRPGLNQDLYLSELVDGEPLPARPLSLLNSPGDDIAPAFAGDRLYFASDRTGGAGGFDLYVSRYHQGAFDLPETLGESLNTAADECDPAPIPGSRALAFASNRLRGRRSDFDLYLAAPSNTMDAPEQDAYRIEPLAPVNSPFDEREPAFARDGVTLLFASDREDSQGGFDLFRSIRSIGDQGVFLPPMPLLGVNSSASERGPMPSADGFSLMFAMEGNRDDFDLYRARSLELFRVPGRPIGWIDLLILLSLLLVALLAFLAKRWESLDVLYKCFLAALLLHLLLLWYFQRVLVEGEQIDLPGRDVLFHVKIAASRSNDAAQRERGGRLESERAETSPGTPGRFETELEASRPTSAPASALTRARRPAEAGPERAADRAAAEKAAVRPEVAYQDQAPSGERRTAAARELSLGSPGSAAAPARSAAGAPERAESNSLALLLTSSRSSGPSPARLARSERAEQDLREAPPAKSEAAALPSESGGVAHAATDLEDGETFSARSEAAASASAALAPSPASAAPDRSETAAGLPGRFESLARELLDGELLVPAGRAEPPDFAGLDLPANHGDSGKDVPPERESFGGAPQDGEIELPAVALHDGAALDPALGAKAGEAADSAHAGDALAQLIPAAGLAPARSKSPASGPSRLQFDPASTTPGSPAPAHAPIMELVQPPLAGIERPRKLEHTPYRNRFGAEKQKAIQLHGGSAQTEQAVALGLQYLAGLQNGAGFWGDEDEYEEKYGYVCIGKSALCLLAFLGAGHSPGSNTEYAGVTRRAVDFLLEVQDEATGHFGWTSAYSHAIATYALAKCFAITKEERLRRPLQRAVAEIVRHQNQSRDPRNAGGWGYYNPEGPHFDSFARVSVTSWQVMALESARLGGLAVEDQVFARAGQFLRNAFDERRGYFRYNHDPSRLNSVYRTLPASTPAALFALSLIGDDITAPALKRPREYVLERAPRRYRCESERAFVLNASGNLYFWYYASLSMFRCGGQEWETWNQAMKRTLLPSQEKDGSWKPISPYAERARDTNRDRAYTTAMCVLSLEVYYRYFTPLLQVK